MTDRGGTRRWRLVRARRDAVPASVRRFNTRARQRRLLAARPWIVGLAAMASVAGVVAVLYLTPLLGVAQVRVVGAHIVTADEVQAAAGVAPGTPLARVDLAAVGHRVDRLAPVLRATVSRGWPDTLVIRIRERTAVAAVAMPDSRAFGLLDATGVLFTTQPRHPNDLPLVSLASAGPDDPATQGALTVLRALTPELRARLIELSAEAPTRIRLELAGGREIIWGDATDNDDKARVATAMLTRPGKVIDVSAPRFVTVR
jgi:cell division protein FtsQ